MVLGVKAVAKMRSPSTLILARAQYANSPSSFKIMNKFHSKKSTGISFMVSEKLQLKRTAADDCHWMLSGMGECRWYDELQGSSRKLFMKPKTCSGRSQFCGKV